MVTILSGCGGGYDVFCTLPLYFKFKKQNKKVILLSFSFTPLDYLENFVNSKQINKVNNFCYLIDVNNIKDNIKDCYFPEYFLSKELNDQVYIIHSDASINQVKDCYYKIIKNKKVENLYLIDGGCDVLLSGQESDLATPVEDMIHLRALVDLPIKNKYVCAIGMSCDCNSVPKKELIDRLCYLDDILIEKYLWSLDDINVQRYYDIFHKCNPVNSIVNTLICSRLKNKEGFFLPSILKKRIAKNLVYLDDYMITFVKYNLMDIIKRNFYVMELDINSDNDEIDKFIRNYHSNLKNKK